MSRETDVDDLAVALYDSLGLVSRRLRQLQAPGDLTMPERAALARLNRNGPATAAELARAEQITAQAMGTTLSVLEERGLIERRSDPNDGRRVIMSVTAAGVEMLRHRRDARARQIAKVLGERFTPAELDTLTAAAPLLNQLGDAI